MTKYVMSREDRITAIEELEGCKKFLWDGSNGRGDSSSGGSETFICNAIKEMYDYRTVTTPAIELIARSLWKATGERGDTYGCFFKKVNPQFDYTKAEMQAERLRWVDHLINSLKGSLA